MKTYTSDKARLVLDTAAHEQMKLERVARVEADAWEALEPTGYAGRILVHEHYGRPRIQFLSPYYPERDHTDEEVRAILAAYPPTGAGDPVMYGDARHAAASSVRLEHHVYKIPQSGFKHDLARSESKVRYRSGDIDIIIATRPYFPATSPLAKTFSYYGGHTTTFLLHGATEQAQDNFLHECLGLAK